MPEGRPPGAVPLLVFNFLGGLAASLFYLANRIDAAHASTMLKNDPRPPLLLLRAFRDDNHRFPGYEHLGRLLTFGVSTPATFEEFLCSELSKCGPVIAIGRPGQVLAPLGAARFWVAGDDWKFAVGDLLKECQFVVLVMGELTPGLAWEVQQIAALPDADMVLLVMPPVGHEIAKNRWEEYNKLLGCKLPPFRGEEFGIGFYRDGTPRVARIARITKKRWFSTPVFQRDGPAYRRSIRVETWAPGVW
jgi:hypothetical protein